MLAVCGTCHTRCTNGLIDYKSQLEYKTRLSSQNAKPAPSSPVHQQAPSSADLMPEAQQMLVVACESEGADKGKLLLTFNSSGHVLTCGNRSACIPHTDRPAQARCATALAQLVERGLIADTGIKSQLGRGNIIGWYAVQHAGYLLGGELLRQRAAAKAGSVNVSGDLTAGSGKDGPGGHVIAAGGIGKRGASGGDVNVGPGNYKAGDGGAGPGGDIIFKGGDAE
jgi:hypothetical protein